MANIKITDRVEEILLDYLGKGEASGLSLYHSEYVKEGPERILRIYIDREEDFVGTDDCELVSKYLSDKLDDLDMIEQNYILEVSSPGLDRVLVKEEHFLRYVGDQVTVSLYKEKNGTKKLEGELLSYSPEAILIRTEEGEDVEIETKEIAKVNLTVII